MELVPRLRLTPRVSLRPTATIHERMTGRIPRSGIEGPVAERVMPGGPRPARADRAAGPIAEPEAAHLIGGA